MDDIILKYLEQFVRKYGVMLTLLLTLIVLLAVPLKIMSYGYRPPDDAKRHSAHALDTRSWNEIVVQDTGAVADTNPGWDTLLRLLHKQLHWDQESLLIFSVVALASLYLLTGLFLIKDALAWTIGLLIGILAAPSFIARLTLGRPYIITICSMMCVMMVWRNRNSPLSLRIVVSTIVLALSCWFHGSWYLSMLIPAAFILAGQFTNGLLAGACWLGGSFLGSLLTGHPFAFLHQETAHAVMTFGENLSQRQLVGEFTADLINLNLLFSIAITLLIRVLYSGASFRSLTKDPIFILYILGTILGLYVCRFNHDWGVPAGVLWLVCQWHEILQRSQFMIKQPLFSLGILSVILVTIYFSTTTDVNERWTKFAENDPININDPEMAEWLPEPDGIVYSHAMAVFYQMYFNHPTAPWRYILGYESGIMPKEDLEIFRSIQWNRCMPASFQPWVNKMKQGDRLIVQGTLRPIIKGVEWHLAARNLWIGRKTARVGEDLE
ncbi:MAG: hypothetical protein EOL87_04935 [Spartobacteria bacterium]|nr:hypothetical protein [Spartobacteria bacterium]